MITNNRQTRCCLFSQAALECLLHEKADEKAKVADLESRLLKACESVRAREVEINAVKAELKRVECLNSKLLEESDVATAPPPPPAEGGLDRERLEARLEGLRAVMGEEEEENGAQVRWGKLAGLVDLPTVAAVIRMKLRPPYFLRQKTSKKKIKPTPPKTRATFSGLPHNSSRGKGQVRSPGS